MSGMTVINLGCTDSEDENSPSPPRRGRRRRITRSMTSRKRFRNSQQSNGAEEVILLDDSVKEDTSEINIEKKTVILEDGLEITLDESDEEEECIRVIWEGQINRFNLKPSDKLQKVYEGLSEKYGVSVDCIKIKHGDNMVSMYNTLESLKMRVTEYLEGCAVKQKYDSCLIDAPGKIKIKCIFQASKKPTVFFLHPNQNFSDISVECAKQIGSQNVLLKFDGEKILSTATPTSLDLEGDECFEVYPA